MFNDYLIGGTAYYRICELYAKIRNVRLPLKEGLAASLSSELRDLWAYYKGTDAMKGPYIESLCQSVQSGGRDLDSLVQALHKALTDPAGCRNRLLEVFFHCLPLRKEFDQFRTLRTDCAKSNPSIKTAGATAFARVGIPSSKSEQRYYCAIALKHHLSGENAFCSLYLPDATKKIPNWVDTSSHSFGFMLYKGTNTRDPLKSSAQDIRWDVSKNALVLRKSGYIATASPSQSFVQACIRAVWRVSNRAGVSPDSETTQRHARTLFRLWAENFVRDEARAHFPIFHESFPIVHETLRQFPHEAGILDTTTMSGKAFFDMLEQAADLHEERDEAQIAA